MKLSKRKVLTIGSFVVLGLVGVPFFLKTMEPTSSTASSSTAARVPSLRKLSRQQAFSLRKSAEKQVLTGKPSLQELKKLKGYSATPYFAETAFLGLFEKMYSDEALDEFKDKGTLEGESLKNFLSDESSREQLKPYFALFAYVWDYDVQVLDNPSQISFVAMSPDDKKIAIASEDGTIRVWSFLPNGIWQKQSTLRGHTAFVTSVAFSPDSTKLVSSSRDKTACVCALQPDGSWEQIQVLEGHTQSLTTAVFNHDGTKIATASCVCLDHWSRL